MMIEQAKAWARRLKTDVMAIYIASRDPRTPWHVKVVAFVVAAYAFSPIDLIPDFIPVLGYLDDLIIVPLGIMLVAKMMPVELMAECRAKACDRSQPGKNWLAGALIISIWFVAGVCLIVLFSEANR